MNRGLPRFARVERSRIRVTPGVVGGWAGRFAGGDVHPLTPNRADVASLPLGWRFENIHPHDQSRLEAIAVVNPGV
jgi:hypothetical protein